MGIFLRNHDELTLEMVTDEERDYMYNEYATTRGCAGTSASGDAWALWSKTTGAWPSCSTGYSCPCRAARSSITATSCLW